MTVNTKFVQTPAVALYSGLSVAGTTMRITPFPVDLDGTKLTMTDFGATGYATIDPKVSGYEEIVSFTGITDNGDGTATLTGLVRDLLSKYPYTTPGTGKLHGSSAVVVFSDNPQLYAKFAAKDNDETITGRWGSAVVPTNATDYVNKLYADTLATGVATYAANIVTGVAGENLTSGNVVYLKASDGKWYIADSATASKSVGVQLGIVQATALSAAAITVLIGGLDARQTGLTAGSVYYLGVAGAISTTKGANIRLVGQVPNGSTTTLVVNFASSDPEIMIVDGSRTYVADTGAANAYVMTLVPAITAYKAGQIFSFKAVNANTGASTLNVNGLGAKSIKKVDGATALVANDIIAGQLIIVGYDGTNFQMLTPSGTAGLSGSIDFGDGSDGSVTFDGSTTILGMAPSSSIYTMTRDIFCINITISTGVTINTAGYIIFCNGTLTRNGTGVILNNGSLGGNGGNGANATNGGIAAGGTAGAAATAAPGVTVPASVAGKIGGVGGAGGQYLGAAAVAGTAAADGVSPVNSLGSNGVAPSSGTSGAGGTGSVAGAAAPANGAGGTVTASKTRPTSPYLVRLLGIFVSGTFTQFSANAGNPGGSGGSGGGAANSGGAGGGGAGAGGGGSGSQGGWVVVFAFNIVDNNAGVTFFQAKGGVGGNGGTGGNGWNSGNNGGGGGGAPGLGGNGGIVLIVYRTKSGTITFDVTGGANGSQGVGGTGNGGGAAGGTSTIAGTPISGQTFQIQIA